MQWLWHQMHNFFSFPIYNSYQKCNITLLQQDLTKIGNAKFPALKKVSFSVLPSHESLSIHVFKALAYMYETRLIILYLKFSD